MRNLFFAIFFSIVLFSVGWAQNLPLGASSWIEGEVLVKLSTNSQETPCKMSLEHWSSMGIRLKSVDYLKEGWFLLKSDATTERLLSEVKSDNSVLFVEPNYRARALSDVPNDPLFIDQWGLSNSVENVDVSALGAWKSNTEGNGVIAVLDTGIDYNHIDLSRNMWINPNPVSNDRYGYDFVNVDGDPMDDNFHGTHCAGIIGAVGNNEIGVSGVIWKGSLMAVKCLDSGGSGDVATIIQGINYILNLKRKGVPIVAVNASLGFGGYSQAAYEAIYALSKESIMFVAAAGNAGTDNDIDPSYPGNYDLPNVISVANMNRNGSLNNSSCYGAKTVHIAAPGTDIISTVPQDPYDPTSGDLSLFFDDMESDKDNWLVSGDWKLNSYGVDPWGIGPLYRSPEKSWKLTFQSGGGQAYLALKNSLDLSGVSENLEVYAGFFVRGWFDGYWGYDDEWVALQCQSDPSAEWVEIGRLRKNGLDHMKFSKVGGRIPRDMRRSDVKFRVVVNWSSGTIPSSSFFYLDDFGVGMAGTTEKYDIKSGTSMAAPHVSGAVSLLKEVFPLESMDMIRWRILRSTSQLEGLRDKVATGGCLNLDMAMKTAPPRFFKANPLNGGRLGTSGTMVWDFQKDSALDLEYRLFVGPIESGVMKEFYRGKKNQWPLDGSLPPGEYCWQVVAVDEPGGNSSSFVVSSDVKKITLEAGIDEIGSPLSTDLLIKEGLEGRLFVGAPLSIDVAIHNTFAITYGGLGEIIPKKGLTPPQVLAEKLGVAPSTLIDQMSFFAPILDKSGNRAFFDVTISVSEAELSKGGATVEELANDAIINKLGLFVFVEDKKFCLSSLFNKNADDMFEISSRMSNGEKIYDICWTVCLVDDSESSVSIWKDSLGRNFFLVKDGNKDDRLELALAITSSKGSTSSSGGCQISSIGVYQLILLFLIPILCLMRRENIKLFF